VGDWQSSIGDRLDPVSVTAVIKEGDGTWILSGTNTYTGATTMNGGTLRVNGSIGTGTMTVNGGTLGGSGVIHGPITVFPLPSTPAFLSPGDSIGTLTINNDLTLIGYVTTVMEVSHTGHDKVEGVNALALDGTLQVIVQGPLTGSEVFQLFSASTITGDFSYYDLPQLPYPLAWDTSSVPVNGTLRITGGPPVLDVARNGNVLTFSWADAAFRLQAQTNTLNVGLSGEWSDYPGGSSSPVNVTINPANPTVFFRLISP